MTSSHPVLQNVTSDDELTYVTSYNAMPTYTMAAGPQVNDSPPAHGFNIEDNIKLQLAGQFFIRKTSRFEC